MIKKLSFLTMCIVALALTVVGVKADSPYTTWAMGPGGYPIMTQDAYSPIDEIDLPVSGAEDMFVMPDGVIYVADTGNGRIARLENFELTASYGEGVLEQPTGLFVDDSGKIYVADGMKNEILIFDRDGTLLKEFGKPTEPLYGKGKEFLPRKIAVDVRKNLYIISEGSVNGIVQMNTDGNFIGYFGANTASMSLKMILQRLFLTKEQLDQFIKNEAASPSNIGIGQQSMIYTITAGTSREKSIRKFTISGKNIFPDTYGSTTFRDLDISDLGLILAVDSTGQIYEYDLNGTLLFLFGAKDNGDQRMGTLRNPTAISRYKDLVYVLDKDKNALVVYQVTAFAKQVHDGVGLYMAGFYDEAKPYFESVLKYNGSFIMSYQAIADAYFKEGDYAAALTAYRYAEDPKGYSQAYWELRNQVLQRYLGGAMIGLIGLWLGLAIAGRVDRRRHFTAPLRHWFEGLQSHRWVDDFVFMFRFIKQPADSFYYIKKNQRGSLRFALLVYLWVILVRVLTLYVTGFVFNPYARSIAVPLANEILYTVGLILLWNAANYLISTISDGEGRVRDVVIGSAYSLFPYALFALPIALVSNVLTGNEVFIYTFSQNLMFAWTALMLFLMVKEVHNYTFGETVRNILLTIFTMGLFVLTGYILYVLFNQLFEFISAILQEVRISG